MLIVLVIFVGASVCFCEKVIASVGSVSQQ